MANTYAEMVPEMREMLGVDSSYDTTILPNILKRAAKKLLRDYHFPKSLIRTEFTTVLDQQSYALPTGFKKEYLVILYEPTDDEYSQPLLKREGLTLVDRSGEACYYWMQGTNLWTDVKIEQQSVGINLFIYHETMDPDANEAWLVPDFEDVLYSFAMYRAASSLRKHELVKVWKPLWAEERESLAKFTNELQFDNMEIMMNASTSDVPALRYDYPGSN